MTRSLGTLLRTTITGVLRTPKSDLPMPHGPTSPLPRENAYPCDTIECDVPVHLTEDQRIELAARCPDARHLERVSDAGQVKTLADGQRVQTMFNGIRIIAGSYYGDWMQRLIERCKGHHEPQEEVVFDAILRHLGPKARMIELGGNWSFYSIWFLLKAHQRCAVILEPDPAYLHAGQMNADLNGVEATFVNAFVGRTSKPASAFQTESSGVLDIPRICVPDLLKDVGWDSLDVLHCDTQGAELDVLKSCVPQFQNGAIRWVVVSTHAHHISGDALTHQRCLALLRQSGAQIVAEHDVHESFSGDGLIVAHFGALPDGWQSPDISYNRYSRSFFRNPLFDIALQDNPGAPPPSDGC